MQVNNVSGVSFQAYIPKRLKDRIFYDSKKADIPYDSFCTHCKKFESWGDEADVITDLKPNGLIGNVLYLINSRIAPFQRVKLPDKGNVLDSFMSLREIDIEKAENQFKL